MQRSRWLILLFVLALVAAACGGDDDSGDDGGDTTAATEAPAETEATEAPAETTEATEAPAETTEATEAEMEEMGEVRVGFIPGPYADLFRGGIQPGLEGLGYTVTVEEISDFTIPNQATMDGDLEATIFQNDGFMNLFNSEGGGDLVGLIKIPSAPLGFYAGAGAATTPEDVEDGSVIGITSEASTLARSLAFLEVIGLIEVGEVAEGELATPADITSNPKNLEFEELDAPQIPRALPDVDYAVALGNHVYAADNVTLSDAMMLEEIPEASQITVTVRSDNAEAGWATAMVEIIESDDFRSFIEADPNFSAFHKPDWWN